MGRTGKVALGLIAVAVGVLGVRVGGTPPCPPLAGGPLERGTPPCPPLAGGSLGGARSFEALTPTRYLLGAGVFVTNGPGCDVDPETGTATIVEKDLEGLRRARTGGDAREGLFGAGWRCELDARVLALEGEDAFVVERIEGASFFEPAGQGIYLSARGHVEFLHRTATGYELAASDGRTFNFDGQGRLAAIDGLKIQRDATRIVAGPLELELAAGRVTRARWGSEWVGYHYSATGELERVSGFTERRYWTVARCVARIEGSRGLLLALAYEGRRVSSISDASGEVRSFVYNAAGDRRETHVTALGGTTAYRFGREEVAVRLPGGFEHVRFDARGRLVERTRDGMREAWEYDALGRLVAIESRGKRRALRWVDGRCTGIEGGVPREEALAAPVPLDVHVRTDSEGTILGVTGPAGEVGIERDRAGHVVGVSTAGGRRWGFEPGARGLSAVTGPWGRVELERDEQGRIVRRTDESGRSVRFEHDARGRVVRATAANGEEVVIPSSSEEAPFGAPGEATRARGRAEKLLLDTAAGTFTFERGRITAPNGVTTTAQVTSDSSHVHVASIDGAVFDVKRTGINFDAAGRMSSVGNAKLTWDADGNLLGEGNVRREHDQLGRLIKIGDDSVDYDEAGRIVARHRSFGTDRFEYDGFGRLVLVARAGRRAVQFAYDDRGHVATRTVGDRTTRFVYEDGRRVAEVGPRGTRRWVHGPGLDRPLAYRDGERWTFLHADAIGTVVAYTDGAGRRAAIAELDAYGLPRSLPGDRPVFFAGRPYDEEAGLYDLRARFYDPELRIFVTPDPSGPEGGLNAYSYCDGDPVHFTDPTGLEPEEPGRLERFAAWAALKWKNTKRNLHAVSDAVDGAQFIFGLKGSGVEHQAAWKGLESELTADKVHARAAGYADGLLHGIGEIVDAPIQLITLGQTDLRIRERLSFDFINGVDPRFYAEYREGHYGGELAVDTANAIQIVESLPAILRGVFGGAAALGRGALGAVKFTLTNGVRGTLRAGLGGLVALPGFVGRSFVPAFRATARVVGGGVRSLVAGEANSFGIFEEAAPGAYKALKGEVAAARAIPQAERGIANLLEEGAEDAAAAAKAEVAAGEEAAAAPGSKPWSDKERLPVVNNPNCFLAGTLVLTESGERRIETLQPGDVVLSRDELGERNALRRIVRLFPGQTAIVCSLGFGSLGAATSVQCTPGHPFFRAEDARWVAAATLRAGEHLLDPSGGLVEVLGLELRAEAAPTFNFEVEETHTYFVAGKRGFSAVWVHNKGCNLLEAVEEALEGIPSKGPKKSLHARLTRIRDRLADIEARLSSGKLSHVDAPRELNQVADDIRNLSRKFPDEVPLANLRGYRATLDHQRLAADLGFRPLRARSHGQPVFTDGRRFITPDVDSHNGGIWKMSDSVKELSAPRGTRMGTYDAYLNRIGD